MHPWILGLGLAGALTAGLAQAAPGCPGSTAPVRERFIAADCPDCWAAAAPGTPATHGTAAGWMLDWLLPRGDDAPMSAAALPAGTERQQRAAGVAAPAATAATATPAAATAWPRGTRLQVESGPAWQGYFGLRITVTSPRALPPGASAWMALVETLPAGSEGSAPPRWLVRNVAGPLPLDGLQPRRPFSHLTALRWPEGAQPERLRARGWIEAADGRILAMGADRCP